MEEKHLNTDILAVSGSQKLTLSGKSIIIGYRVGFDSGEQTMRFTGGGVIIPGIVVFHYETDYKDTFYFEDGELVYMTTSIKTTKFDYLDAIYNG